MERCLRVEVVLFEKSSASRADGSVMARGRILIGG